MWTNDRYINETPADGEWARIYCAHGPSAPQVLHARFICHEFSRHVHEEYVIGLVETGVQRFEIGRVERFTPAGSIFLINPGEAHTGAPACPGGYVYRTAYPQAELMRQAAHDAWSGKGAIPQFTSAVVNDAQLSALLSAYHGSVAGGATALEQETRLRAAIHVAVARHSPPWLTRTADGGPRLAERARALIDARFVENISLSDLAEACRASPFHLARTFRRHLGLAPHTYQTS